MYETLAQIEKHLQSLVNYFENIEIEVTDGKKETGES